VVIGAAAGIALYALRDNIVFFMSPTEIAEKAVQPGARLRVGGLVKVDTLVKSANENVDFVVTDGSHDLRVSYQGLLPDLFREGQGVVAEGVLAAPGQLNADTILAKHDERYMPREVVDALKKQGRWQEGEAAR
jgi:cytochrome c-type biogenesis protein CcmE